jgi:hypothetical protein
VDFAEEKKIGLCRAQRGARWRSTREAANTSGHAQRRRLCERRRCGCCAPAMPTRPLTWASMHKTWCSLPRNGSCWGVCATTTWTAATLRTRFPTAASGPVTTTSLPAKVISATQQTIGRACTSPTQLHSYHFSYGTSFNTSGDAYSYNAQSANTPPESSQNIELGAKIDNADKHLHHAPGHLSFHQERTSAIPTPTPLATRLLLSGKRHSAGLRARHYRQASPSASGKSTAPTCGCPCRWWTSRRPPPPPWEPRGRPPRPQSQAQRHGMEHLPVHAQMARWRSGINFRSAHRPRRCDQRLFGRRPPSPPLT